MMYVRGDGSPQGIYVAGSVTETSDFTASELYLSLYQTKDFKNALTARWQEVSPAICAFLDKRLNETFYAENQTAMGKNFALYRDQSQAFAADDWVNDIKALKQWLLDRIAWLDDEWK